MGREMTPEEYSELMRVVREGRDLAVSNKSCIDQIVDQVGDIHDVIYKNGFMARISRIEALVAAERERVDLRFDAQGQVAGLKIDHVKEGSIDWKWLINMLLSGGAFGSLLYYLLSKGGI